MKEMTDEIAFAIWRRFFDQLRFDCLACHARGLFHRPLYPLPRPDELPDDMTPDEFRETVAFIYGPNFDFLCRTLLRREGAYIRRLLQVPAAPPSTRPPGQTIRAALRSTPASAIDPTTSRGSHEAARADVPSMARERVSLSAPRRP
jgi:hypothetical protein